MTLRLILTRHAKSSWDDPMMDDHERPLNARGRKSATAIGAWLAEKRTLPDEVFVSSSQRTRETWTLIAQELPGTPKVEVRPDLYHAEPEALLAALRSAQGETVMIVAHNPGAAYFAQALLETVPYDGRFIRFPTGTTAVISFHGLGRWEHLTWRQGELEEIAFPRDLI